MARKTLPAATIALDAQTGPTLFAGRARRIFGIAFWTSLLSVLTLGIYRFWAKTRLRRYYWSSIRPGGMPLEYVGQPLEKLLGFLIAVTFLAFYIGVVNLLLMFASFSLLNDNYAAYALSFLGVVPLWFFARYRARRYMLARTRFRGLRLGLEPGAWGYAGRALWHWFLTLITLGLLWPRMTFWLEKYKTDRTFLGDQRMHQGGRWTMLYPAMVHLIFPVACTAVLLGSLLVGNDVETMLGLLDDQSDLEVQVAPLFIWLLVAMLCWFVFGLANYRAFTFAKLTNTKTLGDTNFAAAPRRWVVLRIYTLGNLMVYAGLILPLIGLGVLAFAIFGDFDNPPAQGAFIAIGAIAYFLIFTTWGALGHAFVTLPLMRHFARTLSIINLPALNTINQRARDEAGQAEGFAEALDVGAAI